MNSMLKNSDPLTSTLEYYRTNAKKFIDGTINIDMRDLYRSFLDLLPVTGTILDAGCGSGRDTRFFVRQGFEVVAFDNTPEIVHFASQYTGQEVLLLSFDDIQFEDKFNGVWACSSILHVPEKNIPLVMSKLGASLKSGGILYTSHKYGKGQVIRGGRLFVDYTEESFDLLLKEIPEVELVRYWVTNDNRPGRSNEKWLNVLLKKNLNTLRVEEESPGKALHKPILMEVHRKQAAALDRCFEGFSGAVRFLDLIPWQSIPGLYFHIAKGSFDMDTFTVAEGVGKMIIKSQMDFFEADKSDDLTHILTLKRVITAIALYLKLEGLTQDKISRLTAYYKQVARVKYVNHCVADEYKDKENESVAREETETFFDYIYDHEKYPR